MPEPVATTPDRGLKRTLFGAACLSIQPLLLNALSIPAMALIIRRLGPANYGQWVTATSLITAVGFLTSLGLRGRFVRSVAQDPASAPQALAEQLGTRLVLALLAMSVVIFACLALKYSPIVLQCTVIASIGMILTTGWSTLVDLMQALERFSTIASVNLVSGLLLTAASVLVIIAGGGPVALSLAYLIGPLTSLVLLLVILHSQRFPVSLSIHARRAGRLIWASRHFTAQQFFGAAEGNAVALMLPRLIGPAGFGIFAAGALLSDRLTMIPDNIGTAIYPMISKLARKNPRCAARRAVQAAALGLSVGIVLAVIGTVFAGTIAHILLPKAEVQCRTIMVITLWALPLAGTQLAMGYALLGAGSDKSLTHAAIWATIICLPLGIILILRFGILGACAFILARFAVRLCVILPEFFHVFLVPFWRRADEPSALQRKNSNWKSPGIALQKP